MTRRRRAAPSLSARRRARRALSLPRGRVETRSAATPTTGLGLVLAGLRPLEPTTTAARHPRRRRPVLDGQRVRSRRQPTPSQSVDSCRSGRKPARSRTPRRPHHARSVRRLTCCSPSRTHGRRARQRGGSREFETDARMLFCRDDDRRDAHATRIALVDGSHVRSASRRAFELACRASCRTSTSTSRRCAARGHAFGARVIVGGQNDRLARTTDDSAIADRRHQPLGHQEPGFSMCGIAGFVESSAPRAPFRAGRAAARSSTACATSSGIAGRTTRACGSRTAWRSACAA